MYFFASIRVFSVVYSGRKLLKITKYTTFQHFKSIFTSKLSFEYIFWQYKFMETFERKRASMCAFLIVYGTFEWFRGTKNCCKCPDTVYDFFTLRAFLCHKDSFEYIFLQFKLMETFGRIEAYGCTSLVVYGAFEWVRGGENCLK